MTVIDLKKKNQKVLKFEILLGILKDTKNEARILDVGCGKAEFLFGLQEFFPEAFMFGCDILEEEERFKKRIYYYQHDLNTGHLPYPRRYLDAVIMIDVLEHIHNPPEILREIKRILKPDGKFFLHVPNEKEPFIFYRVFSKLTKTDNKRDYGGHIQRFKRYEIFEMLREAGFRIKSVRYNYHLIGDIRDTLKFFLTMRRNRQGKIKGFPRGLDDIKILAGPLTQKLFSVFDFLSYYESRIFKNCSLSAMAMNISSRA